MSHGQPVGRAEMGLVARDRTVGYFYSEVRIGTEPDGSFLFANVPVPGKWYVYAKMDSLHGRGASNALECGTEQDDDTVKLGDVKLQPGHRLSGRVVLTDGNPIPDGMRIVASAANGPGTARPAICRRTAALNSWACPRTIFRSVRP